MSDEQVNIEQKENEIPEQDVIGKRFNWGAFALTWIWGLGNKVWITLIIIPLWLLFGFGAGLADAMGILTSTYKSILMIVLNLILLGLQIWFGINGNKWAWKKKKYKSVESFHKVQRIWACVALTFILIDIVYTAMTTFPALMNNTNHVRTQTRIKNHVVTMDQAVRLLEATETKCGLTSEKLSACLAGKLNINLEYGKKLVLVDGAVYEFHGDGKCKEENACYVTIDVNDNGKTVKLPLYVKSNGFLEVREADVDKFFVR